MKCPQCGREMKDGYLKWQCKDNLAWVPELKPFASFKETAELLWPTIQTFTREGSRASICKPCKRVFFEYGDLE